MTDILLNAKSNSIIRKHIVRRIMNLLPEYLFKEMDYELYQIEKTLIKEENPDIIRQKLKELEELL